MNETAILIVIIVSLAIVGFTFALWFTAQKTKSKGSYQPLPRISPPEQYSKEPSLTEVFANNLEDRVLEKIQEAIDSPNPTPWSDTTPSVLLDLEDDISNIMGNTTPIKGIQSENIKLLINLLECRISIENRFGSSK